MDSFLPNTSVQTEFCGTAKEMEEYERAGTSTATSGNVNRSKHHNLQLRLGYAIELLN